MIRLHVFTVTAVISVVGPYQVLVIFCKRRDSETKCRIASKGLVKFLLHAKWLIFISSSAGDVLQPTWEEGEECWVGYVRTLAFSEHRIPNPYWGQMSLPQTKCHLRLWHCLIALVCKYVGCTTYTEDTAPFIKSFFIFSCFLYVRWSQRVLRPPGNTARKKVHYPLCSNFEKAVFLFPEDNGAFKWAWLVEGTDWL